MLDFRDQDFDEGAQFVNARFLDIDEAFIFGEVALAVSAIEHSPLMRSPTKRMHQALKYRVAIFATVPVSSERRQCGCVCCAIGAVESSLGG